MAEIIPVPGTPAEGCVATHLHARGRQRTRNAEAFCLDLVVIAHPMRQLNTMQPPFPLRDHVGMPH